MAYQELKQRQSVMWGTGPYQRVTETLTDIHERVVGQLAPRPGVRLLDLACGTGAIAERAAAHGATVIGIDLAPALIETARERAAERGLAIDYRVGDCEQLELPDASFDAVSSTCGVMFSPEHEASARELARVSAAMAQSLEAVFGHRARFSITSRSSNTTRSYRGFSQAVDEVIDARVYSGIHFRKADEDGAAIGEDVARYGLERYFERD